LTTFELIIAIMILLVTIPALVIALFWTVMLHVQDHMDDGWDYDKTRR